VCLVEKALAEGGQLRIQKGEELFVGQTVPLVAVERLVTGGADASFECLGIGYA